jgi:hypothetical protein
LSRDDAGRARAARSGSTHRNDAGAWQRQGRPLPAPCHAGRSAVCWAATFSWRGNLHGFAGSEQANTPFLATLTNVYLHNLVPPLFLHARGIGMCFCDGRGLCHMSARNRPCLVPAAARCERCPDALRVLGLTWGAVRGEGLARAAWFQFTQRTFLGSPRPRARVADCLQCLAPQRGLTVITGHSSARARPLVRRTTIC